MLVYEEDRMLALTSNGRSCKIRSPTAALCPIRVYPCTSGSLDAFEEGDTAISSDLHTASQLNSRSTFTSAPQTIPTFQHTVAIAARYGLLVFCFLGLLGHRHRSAFLQC